MPKTGNAFMARAATSACKIRFLRFYFSTWLPVRIALYSAAVMVALSFGIYAVAQSPEHATYFEVSAFLSAAASLVTFICCLVVLLTARKMCRCSYGLTAAHLYVHPILLAVSWFSLAGAFGEAGADGVIINVFGGFTATAIVLLLATAIPMNVYFYKRRHLFGPLISMDVLKLTPPCALCGDTTPGNLRQKVRVAEGKPQVTLCESCMKRCTAATGAEQLQILKKLYNI